MRSRIAAISAAAGALLSFLSAGAASPAPSTVAVVDFYAPTPVPEYVGAAPEQYAADDLSGMLAQAGGDRIRVIPRAMAQKAEADMSWRANDVLHFARLIELAQALHADRLVVGWISLWAVGPGGANQDIPPGGGGPITGAATVVVQIFDAAQGRLVAELRGDGSGIGGIAHLVAEQTLHDALQQTVPVLLSTLTASSP